MTNPSDPSAPPTDEFDLNPTDASRLLRLGMHDERRPVDDLIDHIQSLRDLRDPLSMLIEREGLVDGSEPLRAQSLLIDGRGDLDGLQTLKQRGKLIYKNGSREQDRLAGLAAYFLAVAAALAHHQTLICSRSREELDQVLLDIAEVVTPPWDELLNRATSISW